MQCIAVCRRLRLRFRLFGARAGRAGTGKVEAQQSQQRPLQAGFPCTGDCVDTGREAESLGRVSASSPPTTHPLESTAVHCSPLPALEMAVIRRPLPSTRTLKRAAPPRWPRQHRVSVGGGGGGGGCVTVFLSLFPSFLSFFISSLCRPHCWPADGTTVLYTTGRYLDISPQTDSSHHNSQHHHDTALYIYDDIIQAGKQGQTQDTIHHVGSRLLRPVRPAQFQRSSAELQPEPIPFTTLVRITTTTVRRTASTAVRGAVPAAHLLQPASPALRPESLRAADLGTFCHRPLPSPALAEPLRPPG